MSEHQTLEQHARVVLKRACDLKLRIAVAESCTGGMLAALLTDVEGFSHAFERGFVAYSNAAKCEMLGIPLTLIDSAGPVSQASAMAMAEGALVRSGADVAVATTGFAGPGGAADEEGLVHLAAVRNRIGTRHRECHFGAIGRERIRSETLTVALQMLEEILAVAGQESA